MRRNVLLVTTLDGVERCAALLEAALEDTVETAKSREAALEMVRSSSFGVIVTDEHLVAGDPHWADQLWASAGPAIPLQLNLAISGCERLIREVKAALARRKADEELARRAAMEDIGRDLNAAVAGLLLETELALREPTVSPVLEPKLRHVVELVGELRERIRTTERTGPAAR